MRTITLGNPITFEKFQAVHPVRLQIERDVRWFSNERVAVITGYKETKSWTGFRVFDWRGKELSDADKFEASERPAKYYWKESL